MEERQMTPNGRETEKLYDKDSHRKEFEAMVLSCEEKCTADGKKNRIPGRAGPDRIFPGRGWTVRRRGMVG